jgi:hypothetical protein
LELAEQLIADGAPGEARPNLRELRDLIDGGKCAEAAVLLEGTDLEAELGADLQYYAAVALGATHREKPAIDLLKRAAARGFYAFWCAYHLGLLEQRLDHPAHAAYYRI